MPKRIFAFLLAAAGALSQPAHASSFIMSIEQVGSDVVVTGSGSIDPTGLSFQGTTGIYPSIYSPFDFLEIGAPANGVTGNFYDGATGISQIFTGSGPQLEASSGTGPIIGLNGTEIEIDPSYVAGTAISDSATFSNETIADLGLIQGSVTETWSNGSIEVDVGVAPAPEPAGLIVLAAPVGLLALRRRRRTSAAPA